MKIDMGNERTYVRDVDALAAWVLDATQWPEDIEQCERIAQGVGDSEWMTWYWRQHKVLEHTQHLEAYGDDLRYGDALQFDSVQSALTEFARAAMEADVLEAVGRLEGAMDEPTSGTKSIFPEEVLDDQDRDDPDQFGRLTESALNEDPDLDPMEVV
jgi:hypothetical protein